MKLIRFLTRISKARLFLITMVVTVGVLLPIYYWDHKKGEVNLTKLSDEVYLTSQVQPSSALHLRRKGMRTIVAIRPDGEAPDQPSSTEIQTAANDSIMLFRYVPVPHDTIPEEAVESLNESLLNDPKPVVLYCRTGRRAVRLFALTESMRTDGPTLDAILEMVKSAGFSADDLKEDLERRISQRIPSLKPSQP